MNTEKKTHNTSKLTFHGGAGTVTGSQFLLADTESDARILVDCGLFQGCQFCDEKNRDPFPFDPSSIDVLIITHAHIDHIGRIPKLVKDGFNGVIYSTKPTRDIAPHMFEDSLYILEKEAKEDNKKPLYEKKDVEEALEKWDTKEYHEPFDLPGGYEAAFKDAGHILGSAMVSITRGEKTITFTGDLGNSPAPLLRDTERITGSNYVVMESVYGDRNHEDVTERKHKLEDAIESTVSRGGALMIPAFSLERTQVLLYEINNLIESKRIPQVPVYLDSPLAIDITRVYKESEQYFNKKASDIIQSGDDIFKFPNLTFTYTRDESMQINDAPNPKVIIAGAGMSNGGRIMHHEKRYLPDPNSTLLIVGYQAAGSVGRKIEEGAKQVHIFGDDIPVRAHIKKITGYSSHKGSDDLVDFIGRDADEIEKVFVVMGETRSALFLTQRLRDYVGVKADAPEEGESVEINL